MFLCRVTLLDRYDTGTYVLVNISVYATLKVGTFRMSTHKIEI